MPDRPAPMIKTSYFSVFAGPMEPMLLELHSASVLDNIVQIVSVRFDGNQVMVRVSLQGASPLSLRSHYRATMSLPRILPALLESQGWRSFPI